MKNFAKIILFFLLLTNLACHDDSKPGPAYRRPMLATLKHDRDEKFVGHDGIKKLFEEYLDIRYLVTSEIKVEELKGRTKADLNEPDKYSADEAIYGQQVRDGFLADIYVKFMDDEVGYGIFANNDIKKGDLIGEYTGIITSAIKDTSWAWHYPNEDYKEELHVPKTSVDAKFAGNGLSMVNDGEHLNSEMRRIFLDGYVRTLYIATKDIKKDEQILTSYGSGYWSSRTKQDL